MSHSKHAKESSLMLTTDNYPKWKVTMLQDCISCGFDGEEIRTLVPMEYKQEIRSSTVTEQVSVTLNGVTISKQ